MLQQHRWHRWQLQETADVEAEAAEAVDINALTNGDLIYYLVTADDWLAEHGSEKGAEYDSYEAVVSGWTRSGCFAVS